MPNGRGNARARVCAAAAAAVTAEPQRPPRRRGKLENDRRLGSIEKTCTRPPRKSIYISISILYKINYENLVSKEFRNSENNSKQAASARFVIQLYNYSLIARKYSCFCVPGRTSAKAGDGGLEHGIKFAECASISHSFEHEYSEIKSLADETAIAGHCVAHKRGL
jgi:hypothetical protein